MQFKWINEGCTREVLDQVVTIGNERACNIWAGVSVVTGNKAVPHDYMARFRRIDVVVILNKDTSSGAFRCVSVNSTKGNVSLATLIDYAAAVAICSRCGIARDGAVGEGECAVEIDDAAATAKCGIARDGAVGEGEYAIVIIDAAAEL